MDVVFNVIAVKDGIGYASDFEKNGLFEVHLETGECKYLCIFPNEDIMISCLHGCAEWVGNKIFFVPSAGNNISIYNIDTSKIETVSIPQVSKEESNSYNPKLKFVKTIKHNGFLWLIPATYPGILKLNLSTYEIFVISNWIPDDGYMFRRAVCKRKNKIYAASGNNNNVLVFNIDTETGETLKIGEYNNGIMDLCLLNEDIIMVPRKQGAVVRWNPETNSIKEYIEYPEEFKSGQIVFQYVYSDDNQVTIVPAHASHGIRLLGDVLAIDNSIQWKTAGNSRIEFLFEAENYIYLREVFEDLSNRVFFVNKLSNSLRECKLFVVNTKERERSIIASSIDNHEIIKESASFGFREFLEVLV